MQIILIQVIRIYQRVVSPYLGNRCRFYPSCSSFAVSAVEKYGCLKGLYLSLQRFLRCHPFHRGGYDPVP